MNYESTQIVNYSLAISRVNPLPLDASSIWDTKENAESYAKLPKAYAGQVITVKENDKYELYVLQPGEGGYTLEKPGVDPSAVKQYVMVVDSLPGSNQVEGVLYINKTDKTGSIWTAGSWMQVFSDVSTDVSEIKSDIEEINTTLESKAPIDNPVFTGSVTLPADPSEDLQAVTKQYVDRLIAGIQSNVPGIVDSSNSLPATGYKAGQTWRVAEDGTYAGEECEIGDLIICLKDYAQGTASDADFMIIQANIDGAVTSVSDAVTDGNIVLFNGTTGKVIKDSTVSIASLNDAIAKAHEHANKTQLDTYTSTQEELLGQAKQAAQGLVDTLAETVAGKADKGTTLASYGITDAYTKTDVDGIKSTLETAINGKVSASDVDEKIAARVGEIPPETTIKQYIDTAVGSGGTASAEAIAQAKQEAITASKEYTDTKIGNLGEAPDVVTYVTNNINAAVNVVEF